MRLKYLNKNSVFVRLFTQEKDDDNENVYRYFVEESTKNNLYTIVTTYDLTQAKRYTLEEVVLYIYSSMTQSQKTAAIKQDDTYGMIFASRVVNEFRVITTEYLSIGYSEDLGDQRRILDEVGLLHLITAPKILIVDGIKKEEVK